VGSKKISDQKKYRYFIERIENFLFDKHEIEVYYDQEYENVYFQDLKRIELSSRQSFRSRLHTLLHEAGHVNIRSEAIGPLSFKSRFPFMKSPGYRVRGNKNHRIDILREEVLAWEKGRELAETLGIPIEDEWWSKHRQDALKSYVEWI
tara:strand:+ start:442 stop:888 length:447 start_codon:yes stop_codon:yes gene_type:complete